MAYCANCGSEVSSAFCGNCGAKSASKKPKFGFRVSKKLLAVIAGSLALTLLAGGLVLREYVLPFSGPLEIVISNKTTNENTVSNSRLSLILNGEQLGVPGVSGAVRRSESTWNSHVPLFLSIESKFVQESNTSMSFAPRKSGLTGSYGGRPLTLTISITDSRITAVLTSKVAGAVGERQMLTTVSFTRVNFERALQACVADTMERSGEDIESARGIYEDYEAAVRAARLDGERSLTYSVWASRAGDLQVRIAKISERFDRLNLPNSQSVSGRVDQIAAQLYNLEQAWGNLESVSLREDDSEWGSAWDQVYAADSGLSTAVAGLGNVDSVVRTDCSDSLLRN